MLNKWIISKFRQQPSPAEQAASRIVSALFADLLPGLKSEYELLWQASDGQLKIALLDLQAETLIFALHCLDRAIPAYWGLQYRAVFYGFCG